MRSLGRVLIALVAVTSVFWSPRSDASILIEEYDGPRPDDADRVLGPLRDVVSSLGGHADPQDILRTLRGMPRSGNENPSVTAASLVERTNKAINRAVHNELAAASAEFTSIYQQAQDNGAVVVRDPDSAVWLTKVLVFNAYCHLKLAQAERDKKKNADPAVIAEHEHAIDDLLREEIRSHPDRPVTSVDYGPEIERAYATARAHNEHENPGSVTINVSRPDAEIFIDEVFRGRGTFAGVLSPGDYRVLIRVGDDARRYDITADPKRPKKIDIVWDVEREITMSPTWFGVAWPVGKMQTTALIKLLGDRLPPDGYIFVTIGAKNGKRYVTARLVTNGEVHRRCAIELGGDDIIKMHDLRQCVVGNTPTGYIVEDPFVEKGPTQAPSGHATQQSRSSWPIYLTVGSAVVVTVGAVLWSRQKDANTIDPLNLGLCVAGGLGLGIGLGALTWRALEPTPKTTISVVPTRGGGFAAVTGSF